MQSYGKAVPLQFTPSLHIQSRKHVHTRACVCNGVEVSEQDLQAMLKSLAAQWSRTALAHHLLSYSRPHTGAERDGGPGTHYTLNRDTHDGAVGDLFTEQRKQLTLEQRGGQTPSGACLACTESSEIYSTGCLESQEPKPVKY